MRMRKGGVPHQTRGKSPKPQFVTNLATEGNFHAVLGAAGSQILRKRERKKKKGTRETAVAVLARAVALPCRTLRESALVPRAAVSR